MIRADYNKQGEFLVIDGTAEDGTYQGDADAPPFVVFNVDRQQVVAGPFETMSEARESLRLESGGAQ